MSTENEKNLEEAIDVDKAEEITAEEVIDDEKAAQEDVSEETEVQVSDEPTESEIIEEFAPKPIDIPNYDKEKERRKREKIKEKEKSRKSKKSKKRRRIWKKILNFVRTVFLFIVMTVLSTVAVASVITRINTTEFALEGAIKNSRPETYPIGVIEEELRNELTIKENSERAGIVDIIKDNSTISPAVTYSEIEHQINQSSYSTFITQSAAKVVNYYLYAKPYTPASEKEISAMIFKNSSQIDQLTGHKLYEDKCDLIAKNIVKSETMAELSKASLDSQKISSVTPLSSAVLSLPVLIGMILALMLLIILIIIVCNGFAHKIIGWAFIISGAVSGVAGYLYKPGFKVASKFTNRVVTAITESFNTNALIYGAIVFGLGLLIVLIGSALADGGEEYIDENDYIEEIEQTNID